MTYIIFVIDAAKLSSIKEWQTEDAIRKWLKYACDQDGGRKRRAEKQKCKLLDDIACFSVICKQKRSNFVIIYVEKIQEGVNILSLLFT